MIVTFSLVTACAEDPANTNPGDLNSQPLDGSNSLTGSWYRESGLGFLSTYSKLPVAIKDYGNTLFMKFCNSFEWEKLEKIGNDYYSDDTKILGENEDGEFVNYHEYLDITYPMQKVSNEIVTSLGKYKIQAADNVIAINTEENVCADITYGKTEVLKDLNVLTIETPYAQGSVLLRMSIDDLEPGIFELGRDVETSSLSLSIFPTSTYKHYYAESGQIEIVRKTDNSIAGNFTAEMNWGLRSTENYVEISSISGEFDVTFY